MLRGGLGVLGDRTQHRSRCADSGAVCVSSSASLPSHPRLSHETKLCEQMVLMVQGPGRNPPRQAGQRVPSPTSWVCRELQGRGSSRGRGEAGGRATMWGVALGKGAEGSGARPGWPLKGWSSWGGHCNRPQLSHCRKLLTAPYSLSRTALLLGSQAVMQKDHQPGSLTTHTPGPKASQPQTPVSLQRGCLFLNQRLGTPL